MENLETNNIAVLKEDLMNARFEGVTFHPWIGDNYHSGGRFGVRVLVLGLSHYDWENRDTVEAELTKGVVRWFTQQGGKAKFFTIIANILREQRGRDGQELASVFQDIAFYNFIQGFTGFKSRIDPTPLQWKEAQAPLKTVLETLQPEAVLVLGKDLGHHINNHIPDWPEHIVREAITHPSGRPPKKGYGGYYDEAIPVSQRLVERAKAARE